MQRFCPYCGGKIDPSDRFCRNCGARLNNYSSNISPNSVSVKDHREEVRCPRCGKTVLVAALDRHLRYSCPGPLDEQKQSEETAYLSFESTPQVMRHPDSAEPFGIDFWLGATDKLGNCVIAEGILAAKLWETKISLWSMTVKRGKLLATWPEIEIKKEHYHPKLFGSGYAVECQLGYGGFKPKLDQVGELEITLTVPNVGKFSLVQPNIDLRPMF